MTPTTPVNDMASAIKWCKKRLAGKTVRTLVCQKEYMTGTWTDPDGRKMRFGFPPGLKQIMVPGLNAHRIVPNGYIDEAVAEAMVAEDPQTWVIE